MGQKGQEVTGQWVTGLRSRIKRVTGQVAKDKSFEGRGAGCVCGGVGVAGTSTINLSTSFHGYFH